MKSGAYPMRLWLAAKLWLWLARHLLARVTRYALHRVPWGALARPCFRLASNPLSTTCQKEPNEGSS